MISQECYELGSKSSVIREIFSYGLKRKAEIGEDKVYDFSLGNPSIPAPESVKKAILELMELPPEKVHAYSPAPGDPKVRTAIADSLIELRMPPGWRNPTRGHFYDTNWKILGEPSGAEYG